MPTIRYRQLQSPVGVDVINTDVGAADASRQLADSFTQFSRMAADAVGGLRAQQGAREGEAAGAAGKPAPRAGLRAGTAYGQAYNSAAEAAYSSKVQTDIDTSITQYEQDNEADLAGFTAASQGFADALVKEAPSEYRVRVEQALAVRMQAGAAKVRGQQIAKDKEQYTADFLEGTQARANLALAAAEHLPRDEGDTAIAASVADNRMQLDALVRDNVIDAVTAVKWQQGYIDALDKGLLSARTDGVVQELMDLAGANLEKGDAALTAALNDPKIPDDEKEDIRTKYDQQRAALTEDRGHQHFEQAATLYKRLAADEFGSSVEAEARQLRNLGGITDSEYRSAISKSQENAMKVKDQTSSLAHVEMALQGLTTLDPGSTADRKALNDYVNHATGLLNLEPGTERWTATMTDVAKKTSILPDQAESWARRSMTSGDPTRAVLGAAFYERVHQSNEAAWDYNKDPRVVLFANQLNANMTAVGDPVTAFNMAHKSVYETTDDEKAVYKQLYSENKDQLGDNASFLADAMDNDPSFNPAWSSVGVPDLTGTGKVELLGKYNNLVGQYFLYGGDIDSARKTAAQHILSRTGVTTMNGVREIMDLAPEKMRPGMSAEVIRADLSATLMAVDPTIDASKVRIQPAGDGATAETKGLVWELAVLNEGGYPDVLLGPDNRPVKYSIPVGVDFTVAAAAVAAAKIEAAKKAKENLRNVGADLGAVVGGPRLR